MNEYFTTIMERHRTKYHPNHLNVSLLSNCIQPKSQEEIDVSYIDNDAFVDYHHCKNDEISSTLKNNLLTVFPDVGDKDTKNYHTHVREVLYDKHLHQLYSEYLIKKTWLNSSNPNLRVKKSDCNLFLRIIRQLILHSRDERGRIVDIYQRIEERSDHEINNLNIRIKELEKIISVQNQQIQSFKSLESQTNQTSTSCINNDMITHSKDSSYLVKLPLPLTSKDTRKLIESPKSFVNGLLTPTIKVNPTDGYAYILPSNVLPIAISSGIDFEHVTRNTSFDTLHPRSKYQSPDISMTLSTLKNSAVCNTDDIYYVALGLWSDGCDAGGASKANRSLVKLVTIHLVHPHLKDEHVFPVAFGNNKGDHNYVRGIILNDLHNLLHHNKLCYLPSMQKVVRIQFFLAYIIQDRVEHCDFTGFSGHGGIFSTVPGYSCPFVIYSQRSDHSHQIPIQKSIASCGNCAKYRLQEHLKKYIQNLQRVMYTVHIVLIGIYFLCGIFLMMSILRMHLIMTRIN